MWSSATHSLTDELLLVTSCCCYSLPPPSLPPHLPVPSRLVSSRPGGGASTLLLPGSSSSSSSSRTLSLSLSLSTERVGAWEGGWARRKKGKGPECVPDARSLSLHFTPTTAPTCSAAQRSTGTGPLVLQCLLLLLLLPRSLLSLSTRAHS